MADQTEVAVTSVWEVRRVQPNITLAQIAKEVSIKLEAARKNYLEGFRRQGWTSFGLARAVPPHAVRRADSARCRAVEGRGAWCCPRAEDPADALGRNR
jgi:hypothetical protein